tara:strand:- start:292 stop:537 length:246 start_codon:yes stop_codon:yes gene_type:complete
MKMKARQMGVSTIMQSFNFPNIKRIFPPLIAQDIVSVQPMTAPVSAIYHYDDNDWKEGKPTQTKSSGDIFKDLDKILRENK